MAEEFVERMKRERSEREAEREKNRIALSDRLLQQEQERKEYLSLLLPPAEIFHSEVGTYELLEAVQKEFLKPWGIRQIIESGSPTGPSSSLYPMIGYSLTTNDLIESSLGNQPIYGCQGGFFLLLTSDKKRIGFNRYAAVYTSMEKETYALVRNSVHRDVHNRSLRYLTVSGNKFKQTLQFFDPHVVSKKRRVLTQEEGISLTIQVLKEKDSVAQARRMSEEVITEFLERNEDGRFWRAR